MPLWKATVGEGVRVYFAVITNAGNLNSGLTNGDFDATLISPADDDSTALTVAESTQLGGVYYADIPTAFLSTNGAGVYSVRIGVHAPGIDDESVDPIEVTSQDLETIGNNIQTAVKLLQNRVFIDRAAKQMVIYDNDGSTPLVTFDLFDKDGIPTDDGPYFDKVPV